MASPENMCLGPMAPVQVSAVSQKHGICGWDQLTPDDRSIVERLDIRAGEVVRGFLRANASDGAESPLHDTELDETRPDSGDELGPEHGALRDVHVVAKLEVTAEVEGLGHDDVAVGFEHHLVWIREVLPGQNVLADLPWRWDDRAGGSR